MPPVTVKACGVSAEKQWCEPKWREKGTCVCWCDWQHHGCQVLCLRSRKAKKYGSWDYCYVDEHNCQARQFHNNNSQVKSLQDWSCQRVSWTWQDSTGIGSPTHVPRVSTYRCGEITCETMMSIRGQVDAASNNFKYFSYIIVHLPYFFYEWHCNVIYINMY